MKVWPQQRDLEVIAAPVHTWRVYREDEWRMKQFNHLIIQVFGGIFENSTCEAGLEIGRIALETE